MFAARSIKASFVAGVKTAIQYKGNVFGNVISSIISALVIAFIWASLSPQHDFLTYFIAVNLFIPLHFFFSVVMDYERKIRAGWMLPFAKPVGWFSYNAFLKIGSESVLIVLNFIVGMVALYLLGASPSVPVYIVSIIFVIMYEICTAYLISSLTYFTYSVWGIRVFYNIIQNIFGGMVIPLALFPPAYLQMLSILPFPNKIHYIANAILDGNFPYSSYAVLLAWSLLFIAIGYAIHRVGMRKFESLGG